MSGWKGRRWRIGSALGAVVLVLLGLVWWGRQGTLETVGPKGPGSVELPPLDLDVALLQPVPEPSVRIPRPSPGEARQPTPTPERPVSDRERLAEITSNWVYRGFAGVGQDKTGRFTHHQRGESDFFCTLGEIVEGVTIEELEREAAVARLGQATIAMPRVPELRISPEQMANPAIPSEEEVRQAMTAYWENIGKRFEQAAKRYTPRPGERMPPREPPSPEQVETAKARYRATWVPLFEQRRAERRTPTPAPVGHE